MGRAILTHRKKIGIDTSILSFISFEKLNFCGGQYIIINSGIPIDKGDQNKNYKRAYSILSNDKAQRNFEMAYKTIDGGVVSNQYLNRLRPDDVIEFSGPWGKFLENKDFAKEGKTLVICSDTGVVSALSFVNSDRFNNKKDIFFYWLVPSNQYFVTYEEVKRRLPKEIGGFEIIEIKEHGKANRKEDLFNRADDILKNHRDIKWAFLSGDGLLVEKARSELNKFGLESNHVGTEIYFNRPVTL